MERIREAREFLRSMNKYNLKDIEFTEGGEVLEIPQQFIDDFKFIGMCNYDFIDSDFYKDGWTVLMLPEEEKVLKALGFGQSKSQSNLWCLIKAGGYHTITRLPETYEWYWADESGPDPDDKMMNFKTFKELVEFLKDADDVFHEAAIKNGF